MFVCIYSIVPNRFDLPGFMSLGLISESSEFIVPHHSRFHDAVVGVSMVCGVVCRRVVLKCRWHDAVEPIGPTTLCVLVGVMLAVHGVMYEYFDSAS